jgi:hypothetical protein
MAFEGNVTAAIFLLKGLKPETFRERIEQRNLLDMDWSELTKQQLDILANHFLKRAVGSDDPAVLSEARRQIEAGTLVIDAESTPAWHKQAWISRALSVAYPSPICKAWIRAAAIRKE